MAIVFEENVSLTALNTLGLRASARQFLQIVSVEQLVRLAHAGGLGGQSVLILGGGSNVVLRGNVDGLVLHMAIPGREVIGEDDDAWYVRAGAGECWHDFVRWTLENDLPGLENLSLIPGSVGAAPVQNIGAYGVELCDRFFSAQAVDLRSGQIVTFNTEACRFGYRDSIFKQEAAGRFAISAVTFRLPKPWRPMLGYADVAEEARKLCEARGASEATPSDVSDAIVAIRSRKLPDPALIGNAGSFFKNPILSAERYAELARQFPEVPYYPQDDGQIKISAGWLIDRAGWKGRDIGPVGMYERQALVLVNRGGATGEDVMLLADSVRASIREQFGVELEQEPVLV